MSESSAATLDLQATVTIGECFAIQKQMSDLLGKDSAINLNASMVDKVDAAGMQLLLNFVLEVQKNNMKGEFKYSDVIIESAEMLGLKESLDI